MGTKPDTGLLPLNLRVPCTLGQLRQALEDVERSDTPVQWESDQSHRAAYDQVVQINRALERHGDTSWRFSPAQLRAVGSLAAVSAWIAQGLSPEEAREMAAQRAGQPEEVVEAATKRLRSLLSLLSMPGWADQRIGISPVADEYVVTGVIEHEDGSIEPDPAWVPEDPDYC